MKSFNAGGVRVIPDSEVNPDSLATFVATHLLFSVQNQVLLRLNARCCHDRVRGRWPRALQN
jgi:hypothetical protein